ncbi:Flavin prenyltransferase UbiX [hydrothermal vent metagenome]|uniref:flavin prenyltransferase n=1 Tax=hydrothermal vent metagenome TaxID=652676 RepID=A0A3B0ZBS1_9ZZZZ
MRANVIAIAITGASGSLYGLRLVELLLKAGQHVELMVSKAGQLVIATETNLKLPSRPEEMAQALLSYYKIESSLLTVYAKEDWMAPLASGSSVPAAMVICPCSSGSLASIANGLSQNLIERAADVVIKEQRKLIIVSRETPLSVIHLENMLKLARMGVMILPATPGFYHRPSTVQGLVDFVVARILDQLNVEHQLLARWGE